jgi:hypothetical protein
LHDIAGQSGKRALARDRRTGMTNTIIRRAAMQQRISARDLWEGLAEVLKRAGSPPERLDSFYIDVVRAIDEHLADAPRRLPAKTLRHELLRLLRLAESVLDGSAQGAELREAITKIWERARETSDDSLVREIESSARRRPPPPPWHEIDVLEFVKVADMKVLAATVRQMLLDGLDVIRRSGAARARIVPRIGPTTHARRGKPRDEAPVLLIALLATAYHDATSRWPGRWRQRDTSRYGGNDRGPFAALVALAFKAVGRRESDHYLRLYLRKLPRRVGENYRPALRHKMGSA